MQIILDPKTVANLIERLTPAEKDQFYAYMREAADKGTDAVEICTHVSNRLIARFPTEWRVEAMKRGANAGQN